MRPLYFVRGRDWAAVLECFCEDEREIFIMRQEVEQLLKLPTKISARVVEVEFSDSLDECEEDYPSPDVSEPVN